MRLPEEKINEAILHPEEEIRLTAVSYFADSYSQDPTIMPLVIDQRRCPRSPAVGS